MRSQRPQRGCDVLITPLALLFVASGACALVYQVMWLRMLALIFGVTVYAASTVLASFMAGLALGSYIAGRLASRLKSPLLAFGLAEVVSPARVRARGSGHWSDDADDSCTPRAREGPLVLGAILGSIASGFVLLPETPYKLIMRTFMSVFPYTTLWGAGSLMLGSLTPFELSVSGYERRREDAKFRALFDWNLDVLQRSYVAGHGELREWVGPGEILTDDRQTIEYFLALPKDDPTPDLNGFKPRFNDILRP